MDATVSERSLLRLATRLLWIAVWSGLVAYLVLTLWLGFVGLVYPYQLDYGEGIVLWFSQQIVHGQGIYKGLSGLPYASSNYPPVAMVLSAILMPFLGEGYLAGRLLNLTSALIVALLIYRLGHREVEGPPRVRDSAGAIAALSFIGSPYIYHWVPLFRADLIGLAFAFGGLYCVWLWERTRRSDSTNVRSREKGQKHDKNVRRARGNDRLTLAVATLLFLLALYTKQSLFAAPLAAFLAIWRQSRRVALGFAVALGLLGAGLYIALDYATAGGFSFGLITSNATVFLPQQLANQLTDFGVTFPILILLALWSLVHHAKSGRWEVLDWYALTSAGALVMAGRIGAWENYFFEAIAAFSVLAGVTLGRWKMGRQGPAPDRRLSRAMVPVLLLVQLVLMWREHDPRIAADLVARDLPANRELAGLLARTSGPIISEDMGALVTSGKSVDYYTFQYSALARSGKWDQTWELNGLRQGAFPLVILEEGTREDVDQYRRFTRDFVSWLDRYYALTQTIGKYRLYTSAPLDHPQIVTFGDAIAMVGWSLRLGSDRNQAHVTIVWQAKRTILQRYKAFVRMEDASGKLISLDDHEPRGGVYPTTRWAEGEMVRDVYNFDLTSEQATDAAVFRVGWYNAETGDRLAVPGSADDSVVLNATRNVESHLGD